jgi:hypothetical protein
MRLSRAKAGGATGAIVALTLIGIVVAATVAVLVPLFQSRPLVDCAIQDRYNQYISTLSFAQGPLYLSFDVRNRGGNDAPVTVTIAVLNGNFSPNATGPFGYSLIGPWHTTLNAQTPNWGGWIYYLKPAANAPNITLQFHVERRWTSDVSGISNYLFGEYNGCNYSQTFKQSGVDYYTPA